MFNVPALRAGPKSCVLAVALAIALVCGHVRLERAAAAEFSGPAAVSSPTLETALSEAEHLIAAGEPIVAFAFLMHTMQTLPEGTDTAPLRFGIAQALMAGGRYAQAELVLARLAEEQPDNLRVRLEWAAVLFALRRDDEAGVLFRAIRRAPALPAETRGEVEGFLAQILARQRLRFDWDVGLWYDNNVNNAAIARTVQIPAFGGLRFQLNQQPIGAWVARTGLNVRWRHALTSHGRLFLETTAQVARNTALGVSEHNRTWTILSVGPRFRYTVPLAGRDRPGQLSADVGVERRWWGGSGFATSVWTQLGVDQVWDVNWRAGLAPRVWLTRYDRLPRAFEPTGASLDLFVSRRVGPGWLTARSTLARETPTERTLRWWSYGLNLAYTATVGKDWNGSLSVGLTELPFDGEDAAFLRRRRDRVRTVGLTLSHRQISWEGYLPVLILNWSRAGSNIPLYEREFLSARIGLQRLF